MLNTIITRAPGDVQSDGEGQMRPELSLFCGLRGAGAEVPQGGVGSTGNASWKGCL